MKYSYFSTLILAYFGLFSFSIGQNKSDELFNAAIKVVIKDPDSAATLSKSLLNEGQSKKDQWNVLRAQAIEGMVAFQKNDLEFASNRFLQILNDLQDHSTDSFEEGMIRNYLGRTFTRLNSLERAGRYFQEARDIFQKNDKANHYCMATINLGTILAMQSEHIEALTYYMEAKKLINEGEVSENRLASVLYNIAISYDMMGESDKALEYTFQSLELEKKLGRLKEISQTYMGLGNIFHLKKDLDSALFYYNMAIEVAPKDDPRSIPVIRHAMENIAGVYTLQGKTEEAIKLLKTAQKTRDKKEFYQMEVLNNHIAKHEFDLERYDSAIFYAHKAMWWSKKNNVLTEAKNSANILRNSFQQKKQYDSAYHYQAKYYAYDDSLSNESNLRKFTNLRIELETLEKQKEIDDLKQEQVINKLNGRIMTGGLTGGILFVLAVFGFYRNKQALKQKSLQKKLELNQKQLTNHTLNMVHKNNGFMQIEEEVNRMRRKGDVNCQKLLNIINLNRSAEKDWDNFNNYFSAVHPGFEEKFDAKYPDLSIGDKRLASLIKMKLTNPEIASILNIESKSVRMNKYRLKRKLGLSEDVDLYGFINAVDG